jgi:aryl-alcohol dehydrogenase-like predicted oxidoreductase
MRKPARVVHAALDAGIDFFDTTDVTAADCRRSSRR